MGRHNQCLFIVSCAIHDTRALNILSTIIYNIGIIEWHYNDERKFDVFIRLKRLVWELGLKAFWAKITLFSQLTFGKIKRFFIGFGKETYQTLPSLSFAYACCLILE